MIGRQLKPLLPQSLKRQIPGRQKTSTWPAYIPENSGQARKMLILEGCIQSVTTPNTNSTTANILRKLGITLIAPDKAGCCGAVSQHLSAQQEALNFMRRNIDAWWPYIEQGITAIIITASGCGAMVKEYGYHLKQDEHYADKAQKISELAKDTGAPCYLTTFWDSCHQHSFAYAANGRCPGRPASVSTTHKTLLR